MRPWKKILFLLFLLPVLVAGPGWGQDNSKILDKLTRDQQAIRLRLKRIEDVMERLVKKYEAEGGRRNAGLIRKARAEIAARDVYNRLEEIEGLLRGKRLQVVEKQQALARDLKDIFAILQDRSDLEKLEDVLGALAEGLAKTGELIDEQGKILDGTRRLVHDPADLLRAVLEEVRAAAAAQKEVGEATAEAARRSAAAGDFLTLAAELEALAEREEDVAAKAAAAVRARAGEAAGLVDRALEEEEALAERFRRKAGSGGGETAFERGDLLRRQIAVEETLRKAAAKLSEREPEAPPSSSAAARALGDAVERALKVESVLEEGRLAAAAREAEKAAAAARSAADILGEGGDGALEPKQRSVTADIGSALGRIEGLPDSRGKAEAAGRGRRAAGDAAEAGGLLKKGSDTAAGRSAKRAARGLREAAASLRSAWKEAAVSRKDEAARLAARQDGLSRKMREVADEIGTAGALLGGRMNLAEEKKTARDVAEAMDRAAGSLRQEAPEGAAEPQAGAASDLERLRAALEKRIEEAAAVQGEKPTPAEKADKMRDLARRQKDLEERTRRLMERLRELPDKRPVADLSRAGDNMESAAGELGGGRGEEAEQDEEDAKKALEKAREHMLERTGKYQDIRQQEILFRVRQELESLKKEQDGINEATKSFDAGRTPGSPLRRSEKRSLRELAGREKEVRGRTVAVREKIVEDGSTVFSWILDRNRDDLDEIVDSLKGYRTDEMVRMIQEDVSDRFQELIAAMKKELKRRMEASPAKRTPNDGDRRRQPLIPPVAELIMIKTMEQESLRKLEEFMVLNPGADEKDGDVRRELVKRLANEHMAVTELFEEVLKRAAGASGGKGSR